MIRLARRVRQTFVSIPVIAIALLLSACGGGDADEISDTTVRAFAQNATTWVSCASEGGTCNFSGKRDVRYGTATQYVTLSKTNGTACTNAVFGDPAVGQAKGCSYADTSNADPTSAWTLCASEGQTCSYSGTRRVRYGTSTQNVIATYTAQVACTNATFGDPASGQAKSCWYENTTTDPGTASEWTVCASESQFCAFSGTHTVRYGTPTQYVTGTYSDGIACSNGVFGDPAPGVAKSCSYQTQASAPAPIAPIAPVTPVTPTDPTGASGTNPPIVVNASSSARAGEIVSLQGENFGNAPRVTFDGTPGTALEIVNKVATNWIAVQLPANAPAAIVLRVGNGTGVSAAVKLNAARPLHLDAMQLVPGGAFKVFGRNLLLAGSTPRVTVNGSVATIDLTRSDEHMLSAVAPTNLQATSSATIVVDNGNGSGGATLDRGIEVRTGVGSGDPLGLGVGWAAAFGAVTKNTIDAGSDARIADRAVCNASHDDAGAIQRAIDLAAAAGGGIARVPAGRCRIASGLTLRSNVVLQGAGKAATELVYESNYPVYGAAIDLAGLRDLTLTNAGSVGEGPLLKDSTRVFLQRVAVRLKSSRQMYLSGNRNMVVANCDFEQTGSISYQGPYVFSDAAGLVFESNTTKWVGGAPTFSRVHDSYIHASRYTRDASWQNNAASGTVHSMVLDFAHRVAVVGNTFDVANGPITNTTRNDGETILTEGGGNQRTENLGSVTSATATTLTDPANTLNVNPFGTGSIPENYGVAIVAGKGAGQTRRIAAYSQPTVTVDRAWDIVPDATSRYATFVWGLEKSLIKANTLAQNPRGIWLYHSAIRDVDVVDNTVSEGGGIYLRSYQNLATKSFMPIYGVLVARNKVANTNGRWMSYVNSVFVNADARAFGIATIGVEIKANEITANRPNVESSWEEYAGSEGYANMMRVENYAGYESSAMPRLLGTILANNVCTNCNVGVRIGTGDGGTTIVNTRLVGGGTLTDDWATTSTSEKSIGTLIR